jgi:cobalt-zinc-cadmium efflux system protein
MGHGHGHGIPLARPTSASARHVRSLWAALCIGVVVLVVEAVVGLTTSSLALLSDAAHMLTDVVGLGMALAAVVFARRAATGPRHTFGVYRAEVLAALANALLLFGVAGYVLFEAAERFAHPTVVPGLPVLLTAVVGVGANLAAFLLLRRGAEESLNLRGAYLEVLSDLLGSLGVLASGVVTLTSGWRYADPIVGVAIGLFVLPRTAKLARHALRILFQHAPERLDLDALAGDLGQVDGVAGVHDLHVWTLTPGMEVASAHLTVPTGVDQDGVLRTAQRLLAERYHIEHATLQVESRQSAARCRALSW